MNVFNGNAASVVSNQNYSFSPPWIEVDWAGGKGLIQASAAALDGTSNITAKFAPTLAIGQGLEFDFAKLDSSNADSYTGLFVSSQVFDLPPGVIRFHVNADGAGLTGATISLFRW